MLPERPVRGGGSFFVDGQVRRFLMHEEPARVLRPDGFELTRRLTEVEHIRDAVRSAIGRIEPAQVERVLDEPDDAAELVERVRDITALAAAADLRVGRYDDRCNA